MRKTAGATGTTAAAATETVSQDHPAHGYLALSPLMLLLLIGICGIAYWVFSQLQIAGTEQAVLNILQASITATPGMTGDQMQQFLNGQLNHDQTIADAIGWASQLALTIISFPPDSVLLALHRRHNGDPSPAMGRLAAKYLKWQNFLQKALIGGDVLTDFFYVIQDKFTIIWHNHIPDLSSVNWGAILIGVVYPIGICFVTVFVGRFFFTFLDALIGKFMQAAGAGVA
jgi:hypothetical protein